MKQLKTGILLLFFASFTAMHAQQLPQYSQYMFNEFVINPALASVHDYYQIRTNHRFQWVGISDPPLTNSIAFYGPHANYDMGFGGYVYTDVTGPTSRTGLTGAYAYNLALNNYMRLSMGLSFSMLQYRVDGTQLSPKEVSDPSLLGIVSTNYIPDAAIGAYLYAPNFYAGLSMAQLFNNRVKIFNQSSANSRLKTHLYLTGGYTFELTPEWVLEPSAIVKITAPKEISFDITAKAEWYRMVWGAVSYRFHEAVVLMLGYNYNSQFYFGYAYDIGITELRTFNSGSHEIMIGYRFNEIK